MVKCYRKTLSLSDLWVSSNEKLNDFYATAWQSGESPVPLLVARVLMAGLAMAILVWALVDGASPYWLIYLTNWGLVLLNIMCLSGVMVSSMAVAKKLSDETRELPWYVGMYWFFYNVSVSVAFMITALYWILLYDPEANKEVDEATGKRMFWLDVATHGFNSCLAFMELLVSRTPVRFAHMYQPLGVGLWYAAFSAIYYSLGGTDINGLPYIYEVLDWRHGRRSGAVVALSASGMVVVYTVVWCAALCRDKISSGIFRSTSHALPFTPPDQHMPSDVV